MQIQFESSGPVAAGMRDIAQRRVKFTMRRVSWLIPRAIVRLTDKDHIQSGPDKCCRIELVSQLSGLGVVTSHAKTWRSAIDQALLRAAKIIRRDLERVRSPLHDRILTHS